MHLLPARGPASADGANADLAACRAAVTRSLRQARARDFPYPHWLLADVLPLDLAWMLARLPVAQPNGPDGPRHCLRVFAPDELDAVAPCRAVAETFQSPATLARIARAAGCDLRDCGIRIGLIHDIDGYDSAPTTRQGEARFTMMVALDTGGQRHLGPDIYFDSGAWAAQAPWRAGSALAFAPSERSWHGFEPRMIRGVRATLVVDYVAPSKAGDTALSPPGHAVGRGFQ